MCTCFASSWGSEVIGVTTTAVFTAGLSSPICYQYTGLAPQSEGPGRSANILYSSCHHIPNTFSAENNVSCELASELLDLLQHHGDRLDMLACEIYG